MSEKVEVLVACVSCKICSWNKVEDRKSSISMAEAEPNAENSCGCKAKNGMAHMTNGHAIDDAIHAHHPREYGFLP